jgi:hypothetical protein
LRDCAKNPLALMSSVATFSHKGRENRNSRLLFELQQLRLIKFFNVRFVCECRIQADVYIKFCCIETKVKVKLSLCFN